MNANLEVLVNMEMTYMEARVILAALSGKALSSAEDDVRKEIVKELKEQLFVG